MFVVVNSIKAIKIDILLVWLSKRTLAINFTVKLELKLVWVSRMSVHGEDDMSGVDLAGFDARLTQ
jgi:hypothetical protein